MSLSRLPSYVQEQLKKALLGTPPARVCPIVADRQMRDLNSIYAKLLQVLYPPKGSGTNQLLR